MSPGVQCVALTKIHVKNVTCIKSRGHFLEKGACFYKDKPQGLSSAALGPRLTDESTLDSWPQWTSQQQLPPPLLTQDAFSI